MKRISTAYCRSAASYAARRVQPAYGCTTLYAVCKYFVRVKTKYGEAKTDTELEVTE